MINESIFDYKRNFYNQFNFIDENNNKLMCDNGTLILKLDFDKKQRNIGNLDYFNSKWHFSKIETESNIMRLNDSWSIPCFVINKLPHNSIINIYQIEKKENYLKYGDWIYTITVAEAQSNGIYLFFKKTGFEKKLYIPRHFFKKSKFNEI